MYVVLRMYAGPQMASLGSTGTDIEREVSTMINWDSEDWGNKVHYASNGSWVSDKHGDDSDHKDA